MTDDLTITLPAAAVEQLASRVAEIVLERLGPEPGSPWMTRRRAAAYLGFPYSRLTQDKTIPLHRDNGRVLYHRAELDAYFKAL
jgi:hypothetical protein